NRVVKDLNGLSPQQFLTALQERFTITPVGKAAVHPARLQEFGLCLEGQWYRLEAKEGSYTEDPIGVLDVTILQNHVLSAILDIHDPVIAKRVELLRGIRGITAFWKAED